MEPKGAPGGASPPPLVVDLDGTLTPTDTLAEAAVRLIRATHPGCLRFRSGS